MSQPTVLSLFSGIGGFDLGLERAGFKVIAQAEKDPFCNKVLAAHWPEVMRYGDVRDVGLSAEHARRSAVHAGDGAGGGSSSSGAGDEVMEVLT